MATLMKQRRGTTAEWAAANEILADGAIGVNEDNHQLKIGNGATPWNTLPYSTISPQVVDALGDLIVGTGPDAVGRLARGTTGQQLSVAADGTLTWVTPSNDIPKTIVDAVGDLVVGTGADTVARLARGTTGQQLTVQADGTLAWATPSASGIQPTLIDAAGDLIVGTADNVAGRLAKGSTGQMLTSTAGGLAWATPSADVPLSVVTAAEDLIVGNGNAAVKRLGKGGNGQVLTVSAGGVLSWAAPTAPVPISTVTTAGDLIVGSGAGAVTRLPKGADGSKLIVAAGALAWADDTPTPKGVVGSTYQTTGGNTPSNGAETQGIAVFNVPIVAGRRYTCRMLLGLLRSDNQPDQSQLRVRVGSATTGTIIWANWFIQWAASFVAQQAPYEFDFIGAAATAGASGITPATVAAGTVTFYLTFTKNSGSGNTATMNLAGSTSIPSVMMIKDIGL